MCETNPKRVSLSIHQESEGGIEPTVLYEDDRPGLAPIVINHQYLSHSASKQVHLILFSLFINHGYRAVKK
jgi:hypothetical protein